MVGTFHSITPSDIAAWPPSNYETPVHRQWLPAYAISWEIVVTAVVMGRLYVRGVKGNWALKSFGADDYTTLLGWAFSIAFTCVACVSVWVYGVGRHIWDLRPQYYSTALYLGWLAQLFFIISTGATKLSVFLFYRRLLSGAENKNWCRANYFLMSVTAGIWISAFVVECFICIPIHAFWDYIWLSAAGDDSFRCIDGDAFTIATCTLSIASDFWTAAFPCAFVQTHGLGITKKQKIALNVVFCVGFVVTGIGAARSYYLWKIGQHADLSWIGFDLLATSIAECQLSIICTCAPFCREFFRKYLSSNIQRSREKLSTASKTISTTGHRASARISIPVRGSIGTFTSSEEGLRSPDDAIEFHELDEIGDDRELRYTLAKDEKTGRIFMRAT